MMIVGLLGVAARVLALAVVLFLLLLMAGMGAVIVIHACVVVRVFRRGLVTIAREQACIGLQPEDLELIPSFEYDELASMADEDESGDIICAVCLDVFHGGDRCRRMPMCSHSFHAQCVDSWLLRSSVCPICRSSAVVRKGGLGASAVCLRALEGR